ncbi:MAG: hypothetical protein MZW92_65230 [Comamonadaceae bacterium]|nr:hypothetical protein [Comamonadaceae bacterium]
MRFRVDGALREVVQPNKALHAALIIAAEDHGRARHRREAAAAGRAHLAAHRRARDRRARVHAADRRTASARCCGCWTRTESKFTLEGLGMSGDVLPRFDAADPAAARHRARHRARPARGKTTTLYASLGRVDTATHQRADGRGPDRVRTAGHRPDAGQPEDRPDVREGAARDPAPGPGRHHDRRDPRPRDRADRRSRRR